MAKLVLPFADGQTPSVRLAYGVHPRPVLPTRCERSTELTDPQSRQVWAQPVRAEDRGEVGLRLFATAVDNPGPEMEIRSVDWVSLFSRAAPVLLGLTVEEGAPLSRRSEPPQRLARRAYEWSDAVYHLQLSVRVTHRALGRPLTNASANFGSPRQPVPWPGNAGATAWCSRLTAASASKTCCRALMTSTFT